MSILFIKHLVVGIALLANSLFVTASQAGEKLIVYSASSLTAPLSSVIKKFEKQSDQTVVASFASSSILAKQIMHGAPADIYISANTVWVDHLADAGFLTTEMRTEFLGNALILAGNKNRLKERREVLEDMPAWLGERELVVGNPDHVPVGVYAKAALEKLGFWREVSKKLVMQPNAQAALVMVARNEVPYGILYSTDVALSRDVEIVAKFPTASYPKIVYTVALVNERNHRAARALYDFLLTGTAQRIFEESGFISLIRD